MEKYYNEIQIISNSLEMLTRDDFSGRVNIYETEDDYYMVAIEYKTMCIETYVPCLNTTCLCYVVGSTVERIMQRFKLLEVK